MSAKSGAGVGSSAIDQKEYIQVTGSSNDWKNEIRAWLKSAPLLHPPVQLPRLSDEHQDAGYTGMGGMLKLPELANFTSVTPIRGSYQSDNDCQFENVAFKSCLGKPGCSSYKYRKLDFDSKTILDSESSDATPIAANGSNLNEPGQAKAGRTRSKWWPGVPGLTLFGM